MPLMQCDSTPQPKTPWLTPAVAATYLGIALGTLRNWTSARFVPFAKRGGVVRYHRGDLDKWLRHGQCRGRATFVNAPPAMTGSNASEPRDRTEGEEK